MFFRLDNIISPTSYRFGMETVKINGNEPDMMKPTNIDSLKNDSFKNDSFNDSPSDEISIDDTPYNGASYDDTSIPTVQEISDFKSTLLHSKPYIFKFTKKVDNYCLQNTTNSSDDSLLATSTESLENLETTQTNPKTSAKTSSSTRSTLKPASYYLKNKLPRLKTKLNIGKTKLREITEKCSSDEWHAHTSAHHLTKRLTKLIRSEYNGEMVTQAWCKFMEVLYNFPELTDDLDNCLHLCEAPGAFITGLNHFMRVKSYGQNGDQVDIVDQNYKELYKIGKIDCGIDTSAEMTDSAVTDLSMMSSTTSVRNHVLKNQIKSRKNPRKNRKSKKTSLNSSTTSSTSQSPINCPDSTSTKNPLNYNWIATTLNPYHELNSPDFCISDDHIIRNTRKNWVFGKENFGDLIENGDSIVDECIQKLGNVKPDLVTADGGINCFNRPEQQEKMLSDLHKAEVVAALRGLKPSGNFVLKMFTLFEPETIRLVYEIYQNFESLSFIKPVTSKPGNSETYSAFNNFGPAPKFGHF